MKIRLLIDKDNHRERIMGALANEGFWVKHVVENRETLSDLDKHYIEVIAVDDKIKVIDEVVTEVVYQLRK